MPPIGAFAAGAILHRAMKEVRRMNAELDRVNTGRAIDPPQCRRPQPAIRLAATNAGSCKGRGEREGAPLSHALQQRPPLQASTNLRTWAFRFVEKHR
jgi:hypothetical protein